MGKITIEIKKPQYLAGKPVVEPVIPQAEKKSGGLPAFFKFLLFASYGLCGFAIWQVAQLFLRI